MSPSLVLLFLFIFTSTLATTPPTPTPWPPQFHSIIFNNNTNGKQQLLDLWYDYPNGRNLNIIQNQLGNLIYEVEWNNGTSFTYTLDSSQECEIFHYEVGILIPNWLHGANYLGQRYMDGFLCNVWEKVQFIWYYEDVVTKRPVYIYFFAGLHLHLMTFEVGAVLEDAEWQAPTYCFEQNKRAKSTRPIVGFGHGISHKSSLKGVQ